MTKESTKIACAAVDCEYNNDKNECTAAKVELSDHYIMTLWEGRQHFNRCKTYKESRQSSEFRKMLEQMKEKGI